MKTSLVVFLALLPISVNAVAQQYSVISVKRSVSDIDPNAGVKTTMRYIGTLGGSGSQGNSINPSGQVAGQAYTANDAALHAFLYANGKMLDLGTFGGSISQGRSINARGEVAGVAYTENNAAFRAFVYRDGSMHDLGTLGGSVSQANGINDSG
jgi:probable HAF family extracellular repeat protein